MVSVLLILNVATTVAILKIAGILKSYLILYMASITIYIRGTNSVGTTKFIIAGAKRLLIQNERNVHFPSHYICDYQCSKIRRSYSEGVHEDEPDTCIQ